MAEECGGAGKSEARKWCRGRRINTLVSILHKFCERVKVIRMYEGQLTCKTLVARIL